MYFHCSMFGCYSSRLELISSMKKIFPMLNLTLIITSGNPQKMAAILANGTLTVTLYLKHVERSCCLVYVKYGTYGVATSLRAIMN